MKRRDFLRKSLVIGAATQFPHLWIKNLQAQANQFRITILQTNDTHSRIDPFPMDGSRNQGLGGIWKSTVLPASGEANRNRPGEPRRQEARPPRWPGGPPGTGGCSAPGCASSPWRIKPSRRRPGAGPHPPCAAQGPRSGAVRDRRRVEGFRTSGIL